ncbi:hypothetical protein WDW37_16810 [Bdellovibrionota bacterium FG-1]
MKPSQERIKKWILPSALLFIALGLILTLHKKDTQNTTPSSSSVAPIPHLKEAQPQALTQNPAQPQGPSAPTQTQPSAQGPTPLTVAALPTPVVPQDNCFTVSFHHKEMTSHPDEESCSHHKNWLKFKRPDINPKSVCVRVNGTPVHYLAVKDHADEVIIGSIAGPKSKVTVRFCTGKLMGCDKLADIQKDCVVPKDEFMEAIGANTGEKADARLGQWDPKNPSDREGDVMARLDGQVKKELENLEANNELTGRAPANELFKDWLNEAETTACGIRQAQN